MAVRKIINGCDLYKLIEWRNGEGAFKATYFDLWISIILKDEFDDDWKKMENYLCKQNRSSCRDEIIHYLRLLRNTFYEYGIDINSMFETENVSIINREKKRARNKIIDGGLLDRDRNDWMNNTLRKELKFRAMRGYWKYFPESTNSYAQLLESRFKTSGYYNKSQSSSLSDKLSLFINNSLKRASLENKASLYRALLSVLLEKMDMIDDSLGYIGDLYSDIFKEYISVSVNSINVKNDIYFRDLIELIVWEDYGLTDSSTPVFFEKLSNVEAQLVEGIIQDLYGELSMYCELEYQAEKSLTLLGEFYTNQKRFEMFIPMAKNMGSRVWKRITTMAEMAIKHSNPELALSVYEASLVPGHHEKFLRDKYNDLKLKLNCSVK